MSTRTTPAQALEFVTAVSRLEVFERFLGRSPCLQTGQRHIAAHFNVASAADAFNAAMRGIAADAAGTWLVWVHQDVLLPAGWDQQFLQSLRAAQQAMPELAVAGVYGLGGRPAHSQRAGHVLDRGNLLREPAPLPFPADTLDELLFAVRADTRLELDAGLGFDFYATDLVLRAKDQGWQAAVVDAYCEHWSDTPAGEAIPDALAERILRNGRAFEARWAHRFPLETTWLVLNSPGDVKRFVDNLRRT